MAAVESLLRHRRVIPAPRSYPVVLAVAGYDLNRPEVAIRLKIGRLVRDVVLAAQLFLNLGERIGNVTNLKRKKRPPSGRVGNSFQHLIARALAAGHVGADGV